MNAGEAIAGDFDKAEERGKEGLTIRGGWCAGWGFGVAGKEVCMRMNGWYADWISLEGMGS